MTGRHGIYIETRAVLGALNERATQTYFGASTSPSHGTRCWISITPGRNRWRSSVPKRRPLWVNGFGRMASNIPRLAVTALAERLRITGFVCDEPILWGRLDRQ